MPARTYADLLALWEATPPEPEPAIAGAGTAAGGGPSAAAETAAEIKPNEADDDPHRLARLNLEKYATLRAGRTLRFWRGEWYSWRKDRYQRIGEKELSAKLNASIKAEFDRLNIEAIGNYLDRKRFGEIDDSNDKGPPQAKKVTSQVVSSTMAATASMVILSDSVQLGTWIPTRERKPYISMRNGILDINAVMDGKEESDCILPHSPNWFSLVSIPYDFDSKAGSEPPQCLRYLDRVLESDPERIAICQEWAGYLLLPVTDYQSFFVSEGDGGNGKSVWEAILTAMLGEDNIANVPLENFAQRFQLTRTVGKLATFCGDAADLDKVAEGHIKAFTSGNRMMFDKKNLDPFEEYPTARLMVSCNSVPRFTDRTDGIWRRMVLMPFRTKIAQAERIFGMDKADYWRASGELAAIFNWALCGLHRMRQQKGFTVSAVCEAAKRAFREELNPAMVFLKEHLELQDGGVISSKLLYELYGAWIQSVGHHKLSERQFGRELMRCFPSVVRVQRGSRFERTWCYEGLGFTVNEICDKATAKATMF